MSKPAEATKFLAQTMVEFPGSVVFVLGAGASAPAGVPTSAALKRSMLSAAATSNKMNELLTKRGPVGGQTFSNVEEAPLEVLLPIYEEVIGVGAVYDFLSGHLKRFQGRTCFPPLGYEILAHLMNQELVRHIVSLNFDELLETALDDELGPGNYEKVRSLSQFSRLHDDESENRGLLDRLKLMLKPHGTVSSRLTLRATERELGRLDQPKSELLRCVLQDKHVVFVGYAFRDPDFTEFVTHLANISVIRSVTFVTRARDFDSRYAHASKLLGDFPLLRKDTGGVVASGSDEFLLELGEAVRATDVGKHLPQTTRHQIRSALFTVDRFSPTAANKLLVEMLIFALKVKGKFKTKALLTCNRVRGYAEELIRNDSANAPTIRTILDQLCGAGIISTVASGTRNGVECPSEVGDEVCFLGVTDAGASPRPKEKEEDVCLRIVDGITRKLPELLGRPELPPDSALGSLLLKLVDEFDYDLVHGIHPLEASFVRPRHQNDAVAFRKTLIAGQVVDEAAAESRRCYVVAETGEWLTKAYGQRADGLKGKPHLRIIISDFRSDPPGSLHRARAENISARLAAMCDHGVIRTLDWCLNNHHGTFSAKECLYFHKDGKPPTLQPLLLRDQTDTERLMEFCDSVWDRATPLSEVCPA